MQKVNKEAVALSMKLRGNNAHALKRIARYFANTPSVKYLKAYESIYRRTTANIEAILPELKTLYAATGKPIYIVGTISTAKVNGKQVKLPPERHAFNRRPFALVQKALLRVGVDSCNPANLKQFARAIHGKYRQGTSGPELFNEVASKNGAEFTVKRLQRTNKRSVRGCCAIVVVNPIISFTSLGVQQELAHAIKFNPVPVYRV